MGTHERVVTGFVAAFVALKLAEALLPPWSVLRRRAATLVHRYAAPLRPLTARGSGT